MNKTVLTSFTILCLLFTVFLMGLKVSVKASPDVIYVPTDYPTIQEAINNADEGDIIFVSPGTYYEHVVVDRSLRLVGENRSNTVINGGNIGKVVKITVNDTEIRGFTIQRAGFTPWGSDSGIYVKSSNNIITDNTIVDNDDWAIWLDSYSSNNTITYNKITNNWRGCMLKDTWGNTLVENNITNHGQDGICLWNSSQNVVADNNISSNVDGVALTSSHNNNITSNNITNNLHGVSVDSSSSNKFYHNNFMNNNQQVYFFTFGGTNFWDDGYPSGGNHWGDYNKTDSYSGMHQNETGSDGIDDIPYIIDEANQDNYPLMDPYDPIVVKFRVLYYDLLENYNELVNNYNALNSTHHELLDSYNELQLDQETVINELSTIRNIMYIFTAATVILIATTVYLAIRKPKTKPETR